MKRVGKRRLPWALMFLGGALALCALVMLGQTRSVLQYCAVAPTPSEDGSQLTALVTARDEAREALEGTVSAVAMGGVKAEASLTAGSNSESAALYAMGEAWLEVYPRMLVEGRRISETELKNGERLIMLDAGLAFKLFGTELPEDARVSLDGHEYRVAGTTRHAGSLFGGRGVGDRQQYDAYIPLNAAAKDEIYLDVVSLSGLSESATGAAQLFEETARGSWLADGTMIDLGKEAMRRTVLPRVILLIVGLYVLAGLFKRMTALCVQWAAGFREALRGSYIGPLIPRLAGTILLGLLGYGALIGLTWLLMDFSAKPLYVFTEWVPDNIVAWSSLTKVFWNLVSDAATLVRVGSRELRVIEFWGGLTRWGMVLLLLGAALLPKRKRGE